MSDYSKKMLTKAINNMDAHLSELGLARKAIAKDESCLFRAVSERLFNTQYYYNHVLESCMQYLLRHQKEYEPYVAEDIKARVANIREGKTRAGHLEMVVLTRMYRCDFVLFHTPSLKHYSLAEKFDEKIFLCYVNEDHYDLVYSKDYLQKSAICQSVIYELLYSHVFGLTEELEDAVVFLELQKPLSRDSGCLDCTPSDVIDSVGRDKVDVIKRLSGVTSPPVPYRICKALHPALYRNVELDIVQEEKRESRLTSLAYRKGFAPGDKCQVVLQEEEESPPRVYNAHIQEIDDELKTVVAFIEQLGVKQSVPIDCVEPLPLQTPQAGETPVLPVADLDLMHYAKRNRRRKGVVTNLFGRCNTTNTTTSPRISPPSHQYNMSTTESNLHHSSSSSSSTCHSPPNHDSILTSTPRIPKLRYNGSGINGNVSMSSHHGSYAVPSRDADNGGVINNGHSQPPLRSGHGHMFPCNQMTYTLAEPDAMTSHQYSRFDHSIPEQTLNVPPAKFGPCLSDSAPMSQPIDPNSISSYCIMGSGGQGMYLVPMTVPYANTIGQVNFSWGPSIDPYAKDLPLSGVEYYRTACGAGMPIMYPTPGEFTTTPVLMDSAIIGCSPDVHLAPRQQTPPSPPVMYMMSPSYPSPHHGYQPPGVYMPHSCPVPV